MAAALSVSPRAMLNTVVRGSTISLEAIAVQIKEHERARVGCALVSVCEGMVRSDVKEICSNHSVRELVKPLTRECRFDGPDR